MEKVHGRRALHTTVTSDMSQKTAHVLTEIILYLLIMLEDVTCPGRVDTPMKPLLRRTVVINVFPVDLDNNKRKTTVTA